MKKENTKENFGEPTVDQKGYKISSYFAVSFALLFYLLELGFGLGINYGLQAIIFAISFGLFAVRGYYLRKKWILLLQ